MMHSAFAAATKPAVHSPTLSLGAPKNNTKTEDGGKAEDGGLSSDQLVPDYAAGLVIFLFYQHHLYVPVFWPLYFISDINMFFLFWLVLFCQKDETKNVSDGRAQTISLPSDNCE